MTPTTTTEPKEGTVNTCRNRQGIHQERRGTQLVQVCNEHQSVVGECDTPTLADVLVKWNEPDEYLPSGHWSVEPVWSGVDRANTGGWSTGTSEKLARRLEAALRAGVVATNPEIRVDVNGQTYVESDAHLNVSGRYMNADLKRLGF